MAKPTNEEFAEYRIGANVDDDGNPYVFVHHEPCQRWIFGGHSDTHDLDAAQLLKAINEHDYCPRPATDPLAGVFGGDRG